MAILYRAIWSDPAGDDAAERFARMKEHAWSWAHEGVPPAPLQDGTSSHRVQLGGARTITVRTSSPPEGVQAFERITEDAATATATVWATPVRLLLGHEELLAPVENRMESDDPTEEIARGRPRAV